MKFEQHFYTSGHTEFETVGATSGISRAERLRLEEHSLYLLPTALMYQEEAQPPVKYVFYPLNSERAVVGQAVYLGKDRLGRPGNYFFHNLIVNTREIFASFQGNPAALLCALLRQNVFRTALPDADLCAIDVSAALPYEQPALPSLPQDVLARFLSICLNDDMAQPAVMLKGASRECLEFLERAYALLPYRLRKELSFDTYGYGVNLNFRIQGFPESPEFQQQPTPAFFLHLADNRSGGAVEIPAPSARLTWMLEMIAAKNINGLHAIHTLEYALEQGEIPAFIAQYRATARSIQEKFFALYRHELFEALTNRQDDDLLRLLYNDLTADDLLRFSAVPQIISRYIAVNPTQSAENFATWVTVRRDKAFTNRLFKMLNILPDAETDALSPFKEAIRFELTRSPSQLAELLRNDLLSLPPCQFIYLVNVITKGILTGSHVETIQQQMRQLIERLAQEPDALLSLLRGIETIELRAKTRAALKEAFSALPQTVRTEEIDARIAGILTPAPSLLQRLKSRVFKM